MMTRQWRVCCYSLALWCASSSAAEMPGSGTARGLQDLPDLPFAAQAVPGRFYLDEQHLMLGYASRTRKWEARLDEYAAERPTLALDYNRMLSEDFGAGVSMVGRADYSELLVSGVYAPRRDFQLKLSGAHLRAATEISGEDGRHSGTVVQNGFLLEAKKQWGKARFRPELRFTLYEVQAGAPDRLDGRNLPAKEILRQETVGKSDGAILNLRLQPDPRSHLQFRSELDRWRYASALGLISHSKTNANSLSYSYRFSNCLLLEGRYGRAGGSDNLRLGLAQQRWRLDLSQRGDGDAGFHISYRIPLHRRTQTVKCTPQAQPVFEKILDETAKRPEQIPAEPLVSIEPAPAPDVPEP